MLNHTVITGYVKSICQKWQRGLIITLFVHGFDGYLMINLRILYSAKQLKAQFQNMREMLGVGYWEPTKYPNLPLGLKLLIKLSYLLRNYKIYWLNFRYIFFFLPSHSLRVG